MLTKWLGVEKELRLLERGELIRRQQGRLQVSVARVAWSGEDVGHPPSRRYRQHRCDEGQSVTLSFCSAEKKLGIDYAKPGSRASTPKIGKLVEALISGRGCLLICHVSKNAGEE